MTTGMNGPHCGPDDTPDTPGGGDVVDLDAVRSRRPANLDPAPDDDPDREVLEGEVLMVDAPDGPRPGFAEGFRSRKAEPRPVLPVWLRSRDEAHAAVRWVVKYYTHTAAYHAVRTPLYAAVTAARAPVGVWRIASGVGRWVFDIEGRPLRTAAVDAKNAEEYLKLARLRSDRVRLRLLITAVGTAAGVVGFLVFLGVAPVLAQWAGVCALAALLGRIGSPADRPLIGRAVVSSGPPKLTSDIVVRALGALGNAEVNKALGKGGSGISFPAPITRDGPGFRADVDLPYGVTAADIIERRDRLASGLRRPIGCVWPEPSHEQHAGRLVLWVGDEDMSQAPPRPWAFAKNGQTDLFKPIPFGTDPRGRTIEITLFENNVLIGSLPGGGKTATVRVLALAAALDPTAELRVFNLKNNDLDALEKVSYQYGAGIDDDTVEATLHMLRDLKADLLRRTETLSGLPREHCPDGKVTRALANRRNLGLHPLVAIIDECQNLFAHPEFGKEAGELCEYIIKLGRALGVILILATQRPDASSLPTGVSANVSVRFCLRVMGQTENDMVLGTSMYKNGVRATTLRPTDRGIGYLVGAYDDPRVVRSAYIDRPAADRIATRARALRDTAGTLTGHAIGNAPRLARQDTLLEDILTVVAASEPKVWSETIVARLAEHRPDLYDGWGPEQLAAALKPHKVPTGRQVWGTDPATGKGANRKGYHRDDITTAVTERNRKRSAG